MRKYDWYKAEKQEPIFADMIEKMAIKCNNHPNDHRDWTEYFTRLSVPFEPLLPINYNKPQ
jgi:hypothetical protein